MKQHMIIQTETKSPIHFNDLNEYQKQSCRFPTKLLFRQGEAIDSLCVEYNKQKLSQHGTTTEGHPIQFALSTGTYITKIKGITKDYWNDKFILSLIFTTNTGQEFGLPDNAKQYNNGTSFEFKLPEGMAVTCFFGTFSHPYDYRKKQDNVLLLSSLGIYYDKIN